MNKKPTKKLIIREEVKDIDGYWIYLKDGWCNMSGEHTIVEDTKKEAYKAFKYVERCSCAECKTEARAYVKN